MITLTEDELIELLVKLHTYKQRKKRKSHVGGTIAICPLCSEIVDDETTVEKECNCDSDY